MVTGQATLMSPLGLDRWPSNCSLPSVRSRNARLHVWRYSFPESVSTKPLELRCTKRRPRCFSRRVKARLTVEAGTSNALAAPVRVPACPMITNTRMSLRSGSFITKIRFIHHNTFGASVPAEPIIRIALAQYQFAPTTVSRRHRTHPLVIAVRMDLAQN